MSVMAHDEKNSLSYGAAVSPVHAKRTRSRESSRVPTRAKSLDVQFRPGPYMAGTDGGELCGEGASQSNREKMLACA